MLDHIFLTVSDIDRSIAFYTATLGPLGITQRPTMMEGMALPAIPTSRVSVRRTACSSGSAPARLFPVPCMWVSSPIPRRWSMPRMPPLSLPAREKSTRLVRSYITILATTQRTSSIQTATVSKPSIRAGSIPSLSLARNCARAVSPGPPRPNRKAKHRAPRSAGLSRRPRVR